MPNFVDYDSKVKLEKYYNGRKLRHYLQLLEISETICRSATASDKAKIVAKKFADHYRRMIVCIVMKPFNSEENDDWKYQEQIFTAEVSRLNSLFDTEFDAKHTIDDAD